MSKITNDVLAQDDL